MLVRPTDKGRATQPQQDEPAQGVPILGTVGLMIGLDRRSRFPRTVIRDRNWFGFITSASSSLASVLRLPGNSARGRNQVGVGLARTLDV